MIFILSKLLWMMARPSTMVLILGWIGLVLAWRGRSTVGLALLAVTLGGLALLLLLPVDAWLLRPLEDRFPEMVEAPAHVDGIVVLGGAVDVEMTEAHGSPALNGAAERMTGFVSLARRFPQARLAFAGGNGLLSHERLSESDVARMLFGQLGLDRLVTYDDQSRNTYENAIFLRSRVAPKPGEVWILVTSASHMPRAVGIFRRAGWDVVACPVAYKTGYSFAAQLEAALPGKLANIDWAAHEWVGLVAYWLLGRTDALFPGPAAQPR